MPTSPRLTFVCGTLMKAACQCGFMQPTLTALHFDRQQGEIVPMCKKYKESQPHLYCSSATLTQFKLANLLNWGRNESVLLTD